MEQIQPMDGSGEFDIANPYRATTHEFDTVDADTVPAMASRGARFLAALIDNLLFGALGIGAALAIPNFDFHLVHWFTLGCAILVVLAAQLALIARQAQTVGKYVMRIRVVRAGSDEKCGFFRYVVLRFLPISALGAVPMIGSIVTLVDAIAIFGSNRRCIHDLIADTEVVKI